MSVSFLLLQSRHHARPCGGLLIKYWALCREGCSVLERQGRNRDMYKYGDFSTK